MQLSDNDRVLEILNIQHEDDNTVVTCQAQTTSGELLTSTAKLVVVVEPTSMTTAMTDMTTELRVNVEAAHTDGSSWHRGMRPTSRSDYNTDFPSADGSDGSSSSDVGVTVGMKAKLPAFLTGRTFIMTSAAGGAFLLIIVIVIVIVFKVVRRRNESKLPITTQVLVSEHGNDTYATILEMKRSTGSTYKGSATLPALKSERKIGLADVMRGGSSLSLTARSASMKGGDITERSPLYAKPDKLRNSRPGLFSRESKNDSVDETPEDSLYPDLEKEMSQEQSKSATSTLSNKDLNAEGLIYADLVLNEKVDQDQDIPKTTTGKKTQYAKIVPSGKPRTSL